ncbi:MAG: hypothetical protein M1834_006957 [Cirrosporium novae-zelandiae]|nr:MAG: hypothetical protein M1834_006957 [Cirrosporium novae-zelandiae]
MNASQGQEFVQQLGQSKARFFEVDVTDTSSIEHAVTETMEWAKETGAELGGVIPAAGVGLPAKILNRNNKPFDMVSFDFVINVNLRGTIDLVRQVLPHLLQVNPAQPDGERGAVILVSSAAAFEGQPGQVAYSASKGAIVSLTLPLARELAGSGIRVATIAPSLFESPMTAKLGDKAHKSLERVMEFPVRAGKPDEFARLVKECLENSMLNGTVVRLDGAMRMPSKM